MAGDPKSLGRPQQYRRETKLRFGRDVIIRPRPRGQVFWSIVVAAVLAVIVVAMVAFGPATNMKRSFLRDWVTQLRQAQEQREKEENLQHVQQVKREAEALQQKLKIESEATWTNLNKRLHSQQSAPQGQQTKERQ